ncbi:hypothetical protein MSG28_008895, partial [Choristoneura fumiferana]
MRLENRSTDCNEVIKMRQVFNLIVKMWDTLKLFWSKTNRWHRVFFIFLIVQFRFIPGGQLGFQCNDPALSYPFTGDTINMKWLFGTTLLVPLAMSRALRWYREYLFGLLINLTLVQTLKLIVGSPRPHFFDTCQPEEALNCHDTIFTNVRNKAAPVGAGIVKNLAKSKTPQTTKKPVTSE